MAQQARLRKYAEKRDFTRTAEPSGARSPSRRARRYLIQKHDASHLHYDFRLEHDGVLLSWAIPKGPSLDPADKRLAVHVEDHPVAYGNFEGTIPKGEYGGGTVMLWDRGTWAALGDVDEAMRKGELKFAVLGERLKGGFALVRLKGRSTRYGGGKDNWLLIKERDPYARPGSKPPTERNLRSVKTGRTMEEIARGNHTSRSKADSKKKTAKKTPTKKAGRKSAVKRTPSSRAPAKKKPRRTR
jgi:bifunctional non-homologous end joining protein LigD